MIAAPVAEPVFGVDLAVPADAAVSLSAIRRFEMISFELGLELMEFDDRLLMSLSLTLSQTRPPWPKPPSVHPSLRFPFAVELTNDQTLAVNNAANELAQANTAQAEAEDAQLAADQAAALAAAA